MNMHGWEGESRPWLRSYHAASALMVCFVVFLAATALGQDLPVLDFTGRSAEKRPELLESGPRVVPPRVQLPPPPAPAAGEPGFTSARSVLVRKIIVTGGTVFSDEEIARVTAPYENRNLTMSDMESLRRDLTLLYVNRGYVNSGALIPDQAITDGLLTIRIVEGVLATINVTGNKWFGEGFLRDRIALAAGPPVNILPLQDRLQLLQQDQRIERIHAELKPGGRPGEAELKVQVEEKPPVSFWLGANNYQSPSVGAERGLATLAHQNLSGHGDIASFTYGYSEGIEPLIDTWYSLPVTARDTTLLMRYRKNDAKVVDKVFGDLDIVSTSDGYELSLRQPVYRSLSQEFSLAFSGEYEKNETSLGGESFSFAPGVDNGRTVVVPLRFAQEWTFRTQREVIAARSRFTLGIDAFGATTNNDRSPDGQFIAWLGQLQWARILGPLDVQMLARADCQWASDSLLPVEQMAYGGRYTVRGYRENLLVRDKAFIASLEARVPLIRDETWASYLQLTPFIDYGRGANVDTPTTGANEISSVGLGLRWGATPFAAPFNQKAEAEIFYGYRLRNLDHLHEDVQDNGFHFQVAFTAFF